KHLGTPYAQQWNFGVQRQVGSGLAVAVSYVGTRGLQLFRVRNINFPQGLLLLRPYDGFSTITMQESGATSMYHSLQLMAQRRFSRGGTFMAAYTYGKTLDDAASGSTRYYTSAVGDPANLRGSRGPADFDRTQRLVLSYNV